MGHFLLLTTVICCTRHHIWHYTCQWDSSELYHAKTSRPSASERLFLEHPLHTRIDCNRSTTPYTTSPGSIPQAIGCREALSYHVDVRHSREALNILWQSYLVSASVVTAQQTPACQLPTSSQPSSRFMASALRVASFFCLSFDAILRAAMHRPFLSPDHQSKEGAAKNQTIPLHGFDCGARFLRQGSQSFSRR